MGNNLHALPTPQKRFCSKKGSENGKRIEIHQHFLKLCSFYFLQLESNPPTFGMETGMADGSSSHLILCFFVAYLLLTFLPAFTIIAV
jgi:hypothetical protein